MTEPNIITLDVETAPLEVYCWKLWELNIGLNQIVTEWSILSFAVKRLGSRYVEYHDNRTQKNVRDDYELMQRLWQILDEADIVIAQNGKQFDLKRINARFAMLDFPPPSPVRVVDTVLEARRVFGFTSNKLEWLSKHLTTTKKQQHRKFPGFELWTECLKRNPEAWEEMRTYNIADVQATEELYLKLRPWIDRHPNVAAYNLEDASPACPRCGSKDVQSRGSAYTSSGVFKRLRCNKCFGWSRTRESVLNRAKRQSLLA